MAFITIKVSCPSALSDVLIAELFEKGFESFQEFDDGFEGSCEQEVFDETAVDEIFDYYEGVSFSIKEQEKVNWNEEWEKNYDPIVVENQCIVRATFHQPSPQFDYEIIVTPKMSFGTGHHATTYQVLAYQMNLNHEGKKVLDVGTGTGILAIMARKRGASQIMATDIDDWCIENSKENFALNGIDDALIVQGQIEAVDATDFDIVIANINKNVLMDQIEAYSNKMVSNGTLILSGFYEEDIADLQKVASTFGLSIVKSTTRERWAMVAFQKL